MTQAMTIESSLSLSEQSWSALTEKATFTKREIAAGQTIDPSSGETRELGSGVSGIPNNSVSHHLTMTIDDSDLWAEKCSPLNVKDLY